MIKPARFEPFTLEHGDIPRTLLQCDSLQHPGIAIQNPVDLTGYPEALNTFSERMCAAFFPTVLLVAS